MYRFITHRKEDKQQAEEDSNKGWFSWGQGQTTAKPQSPADKKGPLTPTEIERMIVKAEKEAMVSLAGKNARFTEMLILL